MAEIENVVTPPATENNSVKSNKFKAMCKERWRKFIVGLKRKPQNISFFILVISSVMFMCCLTFYSQSTIYFNEDWMGLLIFVNTMFSVLTLLLFMNTFPKRKKKMNIIMLVLTFIFMAVMIFCDLFWYMHMHPLYITALEENEYVENVLITLKEMNPSFTSIIAHVVLVAISAILLATLPLYRKLIMKIDTRKVIESNEIKEEIDTSEEG